MYRRGTIRVATLFVFPEEKGMSVSKLLRFRQILSRLT